MGACAHSSNNLVLPRHPRARLIPLQEGDAVSTLEGEQVGRVESVTETAFAVRAEGGRTFWLARDDVFWADERGVVIALSIEEIADQGPPEVFAGA